MFPNPGLAFRCVCPYSQYVSHLNAGRCFLRDKFIGQARQLLTPSQEISFWDELTVVRDNNSRRFTGQVCAPKSGQVGLYDEARMCCIEKER